MQAEVSSQGLALEETEKCKIEFLEVGKEFLGCLLLGELKLRFISKVKRFGLVSYF